jgi:hypothetical protein
MQEQEQTYTPGSLILPAETPEQQQAQTNGALTDVRSYQMGVVERTWTPDPKQPDYSFKFWILPKVLKPSDRVAVQNKVNQANLDGQNLQRLTSQLNHIKPDARIERNEATLRKLSVDDEEFAGDEAKFFDKREKLQKQIDDWMEEYSLRHLEIQQKIEELMAKPTFYQTLRQELFARVIHDHTMGIPLEPDGPLVKVDFKSDDSKWELGDELAAGLQDFLWAAIKKEGRAGKGK